MYVTGPLLYIKNMYKYNYKYIYNSRNIEYRRCWRGENHAEVA